MNRRTTGLILAGGRATRLHGRDKALLALAGRPLLAHAIERLRPQVDRLAISSHAPPERYRDFGLPVIADRYAGFQGPLAGIHAGLAAWPRDYLVTVAVDLPFLPADLVARLRAGLADARCGYASANGRHVLALLWTPGMAAPLAAWLEAGGRRLEEWLRAHASAVAFPPESAPDLLLNINTPEDLAAAELRLRSC
jgi:molybdopterin-guanine dinucleotide biosynthesis protein A